MNYGRKNLKAKAEDLQKKGYKLFTLAPIPLLLFLLREDADAMTAEQSFLAAGKQMEGVILEQAQSLAQGAAGLGAETAAQTGTQTAAQTGAKAAAGAAHHGFFATTAGKVVIGVIIAGAVAGGVGGGLAVRHNNQAKEEAEREAEEEARRNELIAEAEAGAAAEAEAEEAAETEIEEPEESVEEEVEEEEEEEELAIPVTDEMYPELLEGGLTKEQFEVLLGYSPVPMSNGEVSKQDLYLLLENITMDSANRDPGDGSLALIGVNGVRREVAADEYEYVYYYDYDLNGLDNFLSVLIAEPLSADMLNQGRDFDPRISGDTLTMSMLPGDYGIRCQATITNAVESEGTMVVNFTVVSDSYGEVVDTDARTAVLYQTDDGRYRIDSIMEGTVDVLSSGNSSYEYDGDYILPGSDSTYLSRSDLTGLSSDELRLARNELYARHGRKFDDATLQEYFNSKDWYNGTIDPDDFSESMLNEYEVANRDLITAYEAEVGSGSGGTNTSSASSDSADENVTGSVREIYEQVLKDVQAGKYDYSAYDIHGDTYQYFLTDMNGDGIKDLAVAKKDLGTSDAGWSGILDDCLCRVFTVTSKGNEYALQVVDGSVGFIDAFYAGDGNGFYARTSFSRANGNMAVSRVTISSGSLSVGESVSYYPDGSNYNQFFDDNPYVTWYDISDLSGLNGI